MVRIRVEKENPHIEELLYALNSIGKNTLPNTEKALEGAARLVQGRWIDFARGGPLKGISEPLKHPSGTYARSIKVQRTGPFEHEIYSEAKIAELIENGTEELDMKTTHPYGPKSRVSKKGVPYLIVPFLWGTKQGTKRVGPKNIVPKNLLPLVQNKRFKESTVKNGNYLSPNARGQMVERWTYTWGDRARGSDFAGTVQEKSFADGMVRFEQGEAADRPGGDRYGGYFTFRVISAKSPAGSWIRKGTRAYHVTRGVKEYTEDEVSMMVEEGLKEDIANL